MNPSGNKQIMARNIRYHMEAAGKNQKELAQIIGVSAPTVNDWLKAKKYPRIDKLELLANYFGCEKSDLIEDKREDPVLYTKLSPVKQTIMKFVDGMSEEEATNFLQAYLLLRNKK